MGPDMLLVLDNQDWERDFCLVLSSHVSKAAAPASPHPVAELGISEQQLFLPQMLTLLCYCLSCPCNTHALQPARRVNGSSLGITSVVLLEAQGAEPLLLS